ncbi:Signal transduction histidine kinase [Flavobacterium aquidurense]|uniref:histidine kinase n=1 Tax=Flavobacterium frigidimaris TaxID=262320 RepID=A0ABX4BRG1_FLAFR|nr:HAMP domain-containing sensor histidine kinase [Flavobacterium frigidimaris]OXA79068.1 two-component sensor histidine kinase [Flavobacterium frigidimaris]SDY80813.1 Signal transduction histidine kinase [Flavobacterium aquidurense]
MKQEIDALEHSMHIKDFLLAIKKKSDHITNFFLITFYIVGLLLSFFYDTWQIGVGVGGLLLIAYYSTKIILPESNLYQYVLSVVLGIFMAQFIYQMHGMFEMHFMAFIASAILITYQNWKLQIPLMLVVGIHHGLFGYYQYLGFDKVYFSQLDYMSLQAFVIHMILAGCIFSICGLWAYQFKKYSETHMELIFNKREIENQELKTANYELDRFVYSTSHDLRAPLNSMLGLIEIAKEDTTEELMLEYFKMLQGSAKKLDGFICDILDYSRNSRMEVNTELINFRELINGVTENLKFIGDNNRTVEFKIEISDDNSFYTDKNRLITILSNLISNAIRYQNSQIPNPFVCIKIETSQTETNIFIKDNGIGIDEESQSKIFGMFYRVSQESVGSGLGLYIVKEAVNKLMGNIKVQSELGTGTTFIIKIPNQQTKT